MTLLNQATRLQDPVQGMGAAVSLPEILSALSFALDLTGNAVPGHALRTCLVGMHIAGQLRLDEEQQCSLYFALLLKDAGCSSNSARMYQLMGGGDDRAVKSAVKLEDWTQPGRPSRSALRMLWHNVKPEAGPVRKTVHILKLGVTRHRNNRELIALRCDRGGSIVRGMGLDAETEETVRCLDEHWDGGGYAQGLRGHAIPLLARIACIAQHLDAFASELGPDAAMSTLNERSGRWFDPELVRVANGLHRTGALWRGCWSPGNKLTLDIVKGIAPRRTGGLSPAGINSVCEAFADVVDAKSPFTFRHSAGVTRIAVPVARAMGMSQEQAQFIYRAALLRDLGKLRVPNSILDKKGRLTGEDWHIVEEHPMLTRQILDRVEAFGDLAMVAGAHHERLDGSGYPDRLRAAELPVEARVLAVADVYGALTEERPYRQALSRDEALAIMATEVPLKLDGQCVDALRATTLPGAISAEPAAPFAMPLPLPGRAPVAMRI